MSDNISKFPTNDDSIVDADFTEVTDEVTEEVVTEEAAAEEFRPEVPRIPIPVFNIKVDTQDWKPVENTPHFVATFAITGVKKGAKTYIIPNDPAIVDAARNKRIGTMLRNDIYQNKFVFGIMDDAVSLMYTGDLEITENLYFTIAQEAPEAAPEFEADTAEEIVEEAVDAAVEEVSEPVEEAAEEAVEAVDAAVETVEVDQTCGCDGDCEGCMCSDSDDGTTAPSESTIAVEGLEDSDVGEGPVEEIIPE